ncbi:MAG: ATPase [Fuerstiella sp.]|nr:ATPase [Fuerstiella sp.]MDG2126648.1 porin [Fuerstiella sp.]
MFRYKILSFWVFTFLALLSNDVFADELTYAQLLDRLQQTEQRLNNLEQQQSPIFRQVSSKSSVALPVPLTPVTEIVPAVEADVQPTFDQRLQALEEGWQQLDSAWLAFDTAETKNKNDAAQKPTFKMNGRIHADFWDFIQDDGGIGFLENPIGSLPAARVGTGPEDRYAFRRIRLEMKGDITETMLWRTQLDFAKPGIAEMKDVYIGFKNLPKNQQLLVGNQKRPLGLDHLNSSRYNVFLERPFVVETFNPDARRPGIAMYGYTDDERYHWRYGAYYLENIKSDGQYLGDQRQMSGNFRLSSSPWYDDSSDGRGYFHWAFAGMFAKPHGNDMENNSHSNEGRFATRPEARSSRSWLDTGRIAGADWYEVLAVESIFNVGQMQIVGEYMHTFMQRDGFNDTQFNGGYVYLSYILTGEHIPYSRKTGTIGRLKPFENFFLMDRCGGGTCHGWGAFGIAARYSYLDVSDQDVLGGVGNSGSFAFNWYWTAYSKLQFNLIYGEIDDRSPAVGTTGGSYLMAGTRFAIEF